VSTDDDQVLQVATQLRNALDRVAPGTYAGVSLGRTMFNSMEGPQIDDEDDTFLVTMSYDTIINN
jgi:DNA-binding transcriptional regulator LsrR (DeoR family)